MSLVWCSSVWLSMMVSNGRVRVFSSGMEVSRFSGLGWGLSNSGRL